ncbi:hypothetical protein [Enhygromyxa salina]|uniref:hypothetical protein n=1 Tax=Enhygromyxa salina TaxID=215803 RepID=UPI0015E6BA72|nr:hypothetical protein [Enhygromyxa salina]
MISILQLGDLYLVLWLHTTRDPPTEEWDPALQKIRDLKDLVDGDVGRIRSFVFSDGGAPNAVQRKELFTNLLDNRVRSAVVTNALTNPIKRGVATALLWLNPNFRAFGPNQVEHAIEHLELTAHTHKIVTQLVKMQETLGPNTTVELVVDHLAR